MGDLSYSEQIQAEIKKSHKKRDMSRLFYYTQLAEASLCASVSYETFKGSWAHSQWIAKYGAEIASRRDNMNKRFGWSGTWK